MTENDPNPIDPRIQAAADKIRAAYDRLGQSQDPLVQKALRSEVMTAINAAVDTTLAVEERDKVKFKPKISPN